MCRLFPGAAAKGGLSSEHRGVTLTGRGECIKITGVLDSPFRSLIEIGDHVTIIGSTILTHDAMGNNHDGLVKVGKVIIEDHVSIGWGTVVLPAVRIGRGAIIAAGSVVVSGTDIPAGQIWGGMPAKYLGSISDYLDKREAHFKIARKRIQELGLKKMKKGTYHSEELSALAPLEIIYLDDASRYAVARKIFETKS